MGICDDIEAILVALILPAIVTPQIYSGGRICSTGWQSVRGKAPEYSMSLVGTAINPYNVRYSVLHL